MSKTSASDTDVQMPNRPWLLRPRLAGVPLRFPVTGYWEIYLILLVAGFLRFYQVDTSEFDDDQAILSSQDSFAQNLQLLDGRVQHLTFDNSSWLVTRWSFIRSEQPHFRTTYNYALTVLPNGNSKQSMQSLCTFTSMREGDQLLVAFALPSDASVPASVTIEAQAFLTIPNNPVYGSLHAETNGSLNTGRVSLQTMDGGEGISVPAE